VLLLALGMHANPAYCDQPGAIEVSITTSLGDDQSFRAGDELSLLLSLDRDAFVILLYQDAAGELVQIFPGADTDGGRVTAGDFQPFPPRNLGLRLVVAAPFGQERLWAFASETPFPAELLKPLPREKTAQRARLDRLRQWIDEHRATSAVDSLTLRTSHQAPDPDPGLQ